MRISIFGSFFSVFHTDFVFHSFASFYTFVSPFPGTFSSVFYLSVTSWVFILSTHWVITHHRFSVTLFPSLVFVFFYSPGNKLFQIHIFTDTHIYDIWNGPWEGRAPNPVTLDLPSFSIFQTDGLYSSMDHRFEYRIYIHIHRCARRVSKSDDIGGLGARLLLSVSVPITPTTEYVPPTLSRKRGHT